MLTKTIVVIDGSGNTEIGDLDLDNNKILCGIELRNVERYKSDYVITFFLCFTGKG